MPFNLRPGTAADIDPCAQICFDAFGAINARHGFPPEIPEPAISRGLLEMCLTSPHITSVVAEADGRILGSNFLWETDAIFGVGPITVRPDAEGGVGRALMESVLRRSEERAAPGVRLVQSAFNGRSMSLYTKLGFDIREPLVVMNGNVAPINIPGYTVRRTITDDLAACDELCRGVHGFDRHNELAAAVKQGSARVVEHLARITGYATDIGFFAHAVAETNRDLMALIGAAETITGPGLLLPSRNGEVFRWCLSRGLRYVEPLSLMSRGLYNEPKGAFLPSILF